MCLHFPKDWRKRYKSESDYFHCQLEKFFDRFVLERFCWSCKKGFHTQTSVSRENTLLLLLINALQFLCLIRLILLKMTSLVRNREMVSEVISYSLHKTVHLRTILSYLLAVVKSDHEPTALMFELILLRRGVLHG